MLQRVEIHNFRTCHDVVIDDIGPVLVLVGRNASGKTNLLKAVNWAARMATAPNHLADSWRGRAEEFAIGSWVSLEALLGGDQWTYAVQFEQLSNEAILKETVSLREAAGMVIPLVSRRGTEVQIKDHSTQMRIDGATACMPFLSTTNPENPTIHRFGPLLKLLGSTRYYPLEESHRTSLLEDRLPVSAEYYLPWRESIRTQLDPESSVCFRLVHLAINSPRKFEEFQSLVGPNGLGVLNRITHSAVVPTGGDPLRPIHYLVFEESTLQGRSGRKAFFHELSVGTRRVIRIVASMLCDQSSVFMLEHPEDGIHSELLRKVVSLLKAYSGGMQIVLTTHSAVVMNMFSPQQVRIVSAEDGQTIVRRLDNSEMAAADAYLQDEGTLSEFLELVEER